MEYRNIIDFWFNEIDPKQWWTKDTEFDQLIVRRFGEIHTKATLCELVTWRRDPFGRLAEVIVLDQFSRNIFRGRPQAYAYDPLALCLAQEAIEREVSQSLDKEQRPFLYMPFMHSESISIHETAVELFKESELDSTLAFELRHKEIIDRFGRYPHRNDILGRECTPEELEFLTLPGSSF